MSQLSLLYFDSLLSLIQRFCRIGDKSRAVRRVLATMPEYACVLIGEGALTRSVADIALRLPDFSWITGCVRLVVSKSGSGKKGEVEKKKNKKEKEEKKKEKDRRKERY